MRLDFSWTAAEVSAAEVSAAFVRLGPASPQISGFVSLDEIGDREGDFVAYNLCGRSFIIVLEASTRSNIVRKVTESLVWAHPAMSVPGLGSHLPHLHRDLATGHIRARAGRTPLTSAPGLGSPLLRPNWDWA